MQINSNKLILFSLIFLVSCGFIYSQNNQTIVPIDTDIYKAIKTMYLELGLSIPSTAVPYSIDEINWALKRIDYNLLSENGKDLYDYITEELNNNPLYQKKDRISFDASLDANLESYLHTNNDFRYWQYGYDDRLPILKCNLELWLFNSSYAFMDSEFKKDMFVAEIEEKNYTNLLFDFNQTDLHIPYRGFLSFGSENWNIQIGREQTSWGNGNTANLLLSDSPDYYDQFRLTTYWKTFKFTAFFNTQPVWEPNGEFNHGYPVSSDSQSNRFKFYAAHRYEWRIFNRVNISFTEACVFTPNQFELKMFNPFLIFHNFFMDEYANPIMSFEIEANPFKYINLYGQICFDQITSRFELENYSGSERSPNAWAYLLGIEGIVPIGPGYLESCYEWVYTDPWMYLQEWPKNLSVSRRILTNYLPGRIIVEKPMGFWAGPDTIYHYLTAGYRKYNKFFVSADLTFLIQGENSIRTEFPSDMSEEDAKSTTPSGSNPQKTGIISLHGEINPFRFFTFSTDLSFIKVWNYEHQKDAEETDIQWVFSVLFHLEK